MLGPLENVYLVLFAKCSIALILLIAAIPKLLNRSQFLHIVQEYRVFPDGIVKLAAHCIPLAELIVAVQLLLGFLTPWSLFAAALLFLLFAIGIAINLFRGRNKISCGCFGGNIDSKLSWGLVLRNICFAGIAVIVWQRSSLMVGHFGVSAAEYLVIVGMASVVFALWLLLGTIRNIRGLSQE